MDWWGPWGLSCRTGDGMDEAEPEGSSATVSSARMPVTLGQMGMAGETAPLEPPR